MKLVYVSGPYTAPSEWDRLQNIQAMAVVAHELWRLGFSVICPNCNTAMFGHPDIPYNQFIKGDKVMVERSHAVVMMPAWKASNGANEERNHALDKGVPVFYWPQDQDRLIQFRDEQPVPLCGVGGCL